MSSLLTVLSVVTVLALFGVLLVGLLLVFKSQQSIRHWFEKTTVGLRTVEHQTKGLGASGEVLTASLREAIDALHIASGRGPDDREARSARWRT